MRVVQVTDVNKKLLVNYDIETKNSAFEPTNFALGVPMLLSKPIAVIRSMNLNSASA